MESPRRRHRVALVAIVALLAGVLPVVPATAFDNPTTTVFINEIHYDNDGTDTGEAVEVAGPAGTDLSGWSIVLYNGNGGSSYATLALADTIGDEGAGFGAVSVNAPGIQNGSPDGLALVDDGGVVVQFLSYEGGFTAADGPAVGMTSTEIGVTEGSDAPVGNSVFLQGTGLTYGDFTWVTGTNSFGSINEDQTFSDSLPPTDVPWINEIHYDNEGTDTGEAIEVAGPAGTDLTGWSIVLYNGSNGAVYNTNVLSGLLPDEGVGFGTVAVTYPTNGVQNGAPDGLALVDDDGVVVQFLSYEGGFTAADGPAVGMTSTDIGVTEGSGTLVGGSLQLSGPGTVYADFTWTATTAASFGCINPGQTDIVGSACAEPDPTDPPWINEIHYDNTGTDTGEAIEVAGPADFDLSGWTIALYNGNGGSVYDTVTLSGSIDDEGEGFGAVSFGRAGIQNGAPDGLALVDDEGSVVQFLSYEGSFVAVGGPANGMTSTDVGVDQDPVGPAGQSLQLTGAGTAYADFTWTSGAASFGCVNVGQTDLGTSTCGVAPLTLISAIQGSTDVSPLSGHRVEIEGVVVGDYEGALPALRGFYVQEQAADWDADPATSEGIFVFHGDEETVNVGDVVTVVGTVAEFQGQTQLGFPEELVVSSTGSVPVTVVVLPLASPDYPERYEGMLVTFPEPLYVTEFFQLGRFGQVVVSGDGRLQQPTAVAEPGAAANAVQAANDLNRLILDDAVNEQNPDPIVFGRNGAPLTAENTLRGGDTVTGATGIMTYTWAGNPASGNAYRLRPVSADSVFDFEAQNPRPTSAPDVGGSLTVASFNVLNYFLTLDQGGNQCGVVPDDCRGAENQFEFDRQRVKLLAALEELDADVLGMMELENTPGVSPEADIAAGLNDLVGAGTYAVIDAGIVGDDVIRVGMIYKPGSVTPVGDPAIIDYGDGRNRASLAQTFVENASGEVFSVVVNHFKSKGCDEATGLNLDQGDGQGCWNQVRVEAATSLVAELDSLGMGDDDWLVIGDLNSYDHEDPVDVFKAAGYIDLVLQNDGEDAYSFVFDGQWGYLDYALASPSLVGQVTDSAEYHINSDEPSVLDYNDDFKSQNQLDSLFAPDEFRTSDHDPVLVGLALDADLGDLAASPDQLWPPNHTYRTVEVTAGGDVVTILGVVSSEADFGLDPEDVPNDIVIVDDDTLQLRAERFSTNGRVYTIEAIISDAGQVVYDDTTVEVPHSRGTNSGR
ncbi:MAG: ExeM/NucH family extracellular endonuclease [Acidimicrobiia bacterium]